MTDRLRTILDAERRIELLRGRVQVGGSQGVTRLVLAQLLAQASSDELRELGRGGWSDAAQLGFDAPEVATSGFGHFRHYSLLQRLSMPLFDLFSGTALLAMRNFAVRLGDSVLMPDAFVGHDAATREYYLEGPPLLAVEIIDPYNPREELERLSLYQMAGTPEVWWLEPHHQLARQLVLQGGRYSLQTHTSGWLESVAVQGLALHLDEAWEPGWAPPLKVAYRGKLSKLSEPVTTQAPPLEGGLTEAMRDELLGSVLSVLADLKDEPDRGGYKADLPFDPRPALAPQPITFEPFISWMPEAKFELMDNRLIVGSEQGNRELLGLLLVNFGLAEAYALLPDETKGALRDVN